jgi:hypothetical protein
MSPTIRNQAKLAGIALAAAVALTAPVDIAFAQSGHFIDRTVVCADTGTQVACTGKVAGLGGTTFTITVEASGTAMVECTNPGGNVAPGQDTDVDVAGTSGPLATPRNGQFEFMLSTTAPSVPNTPTCPNASWTATVVDVEFGDATLTLFENGNISDTITVPVG